MEKFLKRFERYIVLALLGMMALVVLLASVELGVILVQQMLQPPTPILLGIEEMLKIFGFFLMILIGLELMETIEVYLKEETVHAEIIFLVAIIAITRKVIILDLKSVSSMTLIGIACLILSLSIGFYALKKGLKEKD